MRRLGRETSGGALIPEIDGLRFWAIALVVLYHGNIYVRTFISDQASGPESLKPLASAVNAFLDRGFIGVQLFFAISGFVLSVPFARWRLLQERPVSLKAYFVRRVSRLEPPYIVNLLIVSAMLVIIGKTTAAAIAPHTLASMFYIHNTIYSQGDLPNYVTWSLEVEVQFYLAAPLIGFVYLISNQTLRRTVIVGTALAFATLQQFLAVSPTHGLTIVHQLHYFLPGVLLADVFVASWRCTPPVSSARTRTSFDMLAVAAWCGIYSAMLTGRAIDFVVPVCTFTLGLAAFRGGVWRRSLCRPWLYTIGGMCYTIYLYHAQVISLLGRAARHFVLPGGYLTNTLFHLTLQGLAVVVVCSVLFVLFEKPFMRRDWPSRFMQWCKSWLPKRS